MLEEGTEALDRGVLDRFTTGSFDGFNSDIGINGGGKELYGRLGSFGMLITLNDDLGIFLAAAFFNLVGSLEGSCFLIQRTPNLHFPVFM